MYCSGFNSAFVEERPESVPSHSSGSVSSLPRGHHTCRLLQKQLTHWDVPLSCGERWDHNVGMCGKGGIRGAQRGGKMGSEVDGRKEKGIRRQIGDVEMGDQVEKIFSKMELSWVDERTGLLFA